MSKKEDPCQDDDLIASSRSYPQLLYLVHRFRVHGFLGSAKRALDMLRSGKSRGPLVNGNKPEERRAVFWKESLDLRPGEIVEVRTREEISATLDGTGRNNGLVFMPEMYKYCGKRFRVYKRVERMLIEGTGELRRMKNTVLLDGLICDGWNGACDRSCFYFWREAWLRRANGS